MKGKALYGFLLLISVAISCAIGFYGGSKYTKKKLDNYYFHLGLGSIAGELETQVKVLELLRKKEIQKGEKFLEFLIDNNLASLSIYANTPSAERNEEIITAIRQVKDYRKRHPGHQVSPTLSESVQRALDLAE